MRVIQANNDPICLVTLEIDFYTDLDSDVHNNGGKDRYKK